eukprot:TRINITY_DN79174_c0_g1_i1.p1 TRINITY_DN79174_c0_g1~~TRINITY_DN79174_c0_g1_i1.p1  ORF type:complete len:172 (+),score=13.20 TRINITY_DN79174_c0_g1_i1:316-831(+)
MRERERGRPFDSRKTVNISFGLALVNLVFSLVWISEDCFKHVICVSETNTLLKQASSWQLRPLEATASLSTEVVVNAASASPSSVHACAVQYTWCFNMSLPAQCNRAVSILLSEASAVTFHRDPAMTHFQISTDDDNTETDRRQTVRAMRMIQQSPQQPDGKDSTQQQQVA